jgi:hypothetical protein
VDTPGSNTEKLVVAKKAKFFVGGEMKQLVRGEDSGS